MGAFCLGLVVAASCAGARPPPAVDVSAMVANLDPGQSWASFTGCLAGAEQRKTCARAPVEGAPDEVRVQVLAGGAVVTHSLTHPGCLEANVRLTTRGDVATVHERLAGEPCPCACQSTIDTAIGLAVGMWTVRVEVEAPFQPVRVVDEQRLKILEPRAELGH